MRSGCVEENTVSVHLHENVIHSSDIVAMLLQDRSASPS